MSSEQKKEKKNIPINKYSIYEIKSGIDQVISNYMEKTGFTEYQKFSNIKIIIGLIILIGPALSYLYPLPFPENYPIIALGVAIYVIFSAVMWVFENYYLKSVFYCGANQSYCDKLRLKKHLKIQEIRINSEIEDYSPDYNLFLEFITDEGKFKSNETIIKANNVIDERGYVVRDEVIKIFSSFLKKEISELK